VARGLKPRQVTRHFRETWTQKPRLFGPVRRFASEETVELTVWVLGDRKGCEVFREVKPPKGESHERRRCETKPARDSRE
jgi:hypothetical protein